MRVSAATPEENLGVELGTTLMGKYRIDAILGQGGMGVVARATHLHLGEQVAIKFLRADIAGDSEANQRFLREAHAAWKLKDEHVARVLDVGTLDNGLPYLVMEYLEGVDLDGMLEQSQRIAPMLACEFIVQACAGLAEAHALGIVHRDVKPSNFFVTWRSDGSPLVKLLDFGISKVANNTDVSLTQTQSMLGTPAYMSPEQMRSARNVDARTDVWSLGAVLFELCEGTRPFEAESFSEMCVKVAVDDPAPFTVPLPPGLDAVVRRCLEKKPDLRYPDVGALATDLAPFTRDPAATAHLVDRIDRRLSRKSAPVLVADHPSGPVAAPDGAMTPYPPRRTTPWAGGGAMPAPSSPTPPPWSSPALTPPPVAAVEDQPPARPSMSISTPRRIGRIAAVAIIVAGLAVGAMALLGGGGDDKPAAPTPGSAVEPAAGSEIAPAAGSAVEPAAGSAVDPAAGSAAGSAVDPATPGTGSAVGSATPGAGSAVGAPPSDRTPTTGTSRTGRRSRKDRKPGGKKPGSGSVKPADDGDLYGRRK